MKVLDLFSGIGGFSLGLERAGMETIAFCEIEEYPRKVLAKHWPDVPNHKDIRKLTKEDLPDDIGLICGGYPCQPFSQAGKRGGEKDDRHLWPEMYRLIKTIRPRWVIAENVAGHITMGLDDVLSDLERAGYACWTFIIPACAVDARHRRDRVWILANTQMSGNRDSRLKQSQTGADCKEGGAFASNPSGARASMANTDSEGLQRMPKEWQIQGRGKATRHSRQSSEPPGRPWAVESDVRRVVNGLPRRMDRLKGLGNAVVPQIPEIIGRAIMEVEK